MSNHVALPAPFLARPHQLGIAWAFVERQTNLWKRFWAWELVWFVYGVVNTLTVTFIARQVEQTGLIGAEAVPDLVLFLLLGTLVWAYLSLVMDDVSWVITWERWEGTIEHTFMAPVERATHLLGTVIFGVLHAVVRTLLIFVVAVPFFTLDFSRADWIAAAVVLLVGSLSVCGLAILTGVLPLLFPERGPQMSFMVQAVVLLVSGVYYDVAVLPGWLQATSAFSPVTYILSGVRGAIIDGQGLQAHVGTLLILVVFALVLVPASIAAFRVAERWAKQTGRLKRQG